MSMQENGRRIRARLGFPCPVIVAQNAGFNFCQDGLGVDIKIA
ncbi:hypothetical protein [uncultured Tateyamaria sp.]|nr:hypothetical protein [uncultured Tateyamaria sp.]